MKAFALALSLGAVLIPIRSSNSQTVDPARVGAVIPLRRIELATVEAILEATPGAASSSAFSALGLDDRLWRQPSDRAALIAAVDHSLSYLQTPAAREAYQNYPVPGFSLDRVRRSLERFRQLVLTARSAEALQAAVLQEFDLY